MGGENLSPPVFIVRYRRETIEQAETRTPGVFPESAAVACMADAYQSSKSAVEKLFKSSSVEFFSNVEDIFAAV